MFDVMFAPAFARLRELLKCTDMNSSDQNIHALVSQLQQLHVQADQLFISLVFYTRQDLWNDRCTLYRALNAPAVSLPPICFLNLVNLLNLEEFYAKIDILPTKVGFHLLSLILEARNEFSTCSTILELIGESILRNKCNTDLSCMILVDKLIQNGRLSASQLLDFAAWLKTAENDVPVSDLLDSFVHTTVRKNMQTYTTTHKDCVLPDPDSADKRAVLDIVIALISKQYGTDFCDVVGDIFSDLIASLSAALAEEDVVHVCHIYQKLRRRIQGVRVLSAALNGPEANSPVIEGGLANLRQAERYLLLSDLFLIDVVDRALVDNDLYSLDFISNEVLSFLHNSNARELLLANHTKLQWTEQHAKTLLLTLQSIQKTPDSSSYSPDLTDVVLQALYQLSPATNLLAYEYLSDFSSCFSETSTATMANLSLNKIRPQCENHQSSCGVLTVLLSMNPSNVLRLFTAQILRSTSTLAAVMSEVYINVMYASMLPVEIYDKHVKELNLCAEQVDDLLSKCFIFLPQFVCPVSTHLREKCLKRFSLNNESLLDMFKNLEAAITAVADSQNLSTIDSELMDGTKEQTALTRLCFRLLTTQVSHCLRERRSLFHPVVDSMHPTTRKQLYSEANFKNILLAG